MASYIRMSTIGIVVLLLLWLWFLYLHSVCMSVRRERGSEAESGRDLAESYWWSSSSSSSSSCHFQHGLFLLIKIPVPLLCFYSMEEKEEETSRRQKTRCPQLSPAYLLIQWLKVQQTTAVACAKRPCRCHGDRDIAAEVIALSASP